jgi:hypothetical protein
LRIPGIRASHDPAGSNQPILYNQTCTLCAAAKGSLPGRVHASSTCDIARQKPSHVIVRHFRDWLCAAARAIAKSTATQSPGGLATKGIIVLRQRGRSRDGFGFDAANLVNLPMRARPSRRKVRGFRFRNAGLRSILSCSAADRGSLRAVGQGEKGRKAYEGARPSVTR